MEIYTTPGSACLLKQPAYRSKRAKGIRLFFYRFGGHKVHPGAEDIVYHHIAYMHRRRDLHFIQKPHGLLHHILGDLAVRLYRQLLLRSRTVEVITRVGFFSSL